MDIISHLRVRNYLILKFEKRTFWRASLKVLSFTIISVSQESEKRIRKTKKFRKACGPAIFEYWHMLFTYYNQQISRFLRDEMEKPLNED